MNDDLRTLSHILTQYNGTLLKMNNNRKLRKVGTIGDENHNMGLIIHTIVPDSENHYVIKLKSHVGGFLLSPIAHERYHKKILFK